MSEYYRILRGLVIDETIRILQGAGNPGSTTDTDTAPVGSLYLDNVNGAAFSKVSTGTGPSSWSTATSAQLALLAENNLAQTPPAALAANSVALGSGSQVAVTGTNSLAIGDQSLSRIPGGVVQASGRFQTTGDAQAGRYLLRTVTVNGTPTEAFVDGTNGSVRLTIPDDSTWTFQATVTGHRTDASDGHAGYKIAGVVYRGAGAGTTRIQGNVVKSVIAESNTAWDINITTDTINGALKITMTGETGKIIRWLALIETLEITN